ncbi:VapE domain-containing protein [Pseudoalteromonas sp. T1lg88]|uniref:VapE domain-containing protein n=1 Tax=Pseudoalteromonas sp. T1lg88 TaxID=2077104 RepID=UPI0018FEAE47|nr:VapE domain-containing protein [Pseudoalteromonas sp. T1lg88]
MKLLPPDKPVEISLPENTKKQCPEYVDFNHKGNPLPTNTNFQAMVKFVGLELRFNMMTFEPEIYDTDTDVQKQLSPDQIESDLLSHASRHNLNKSVVKDHFIALAQYNKYHPVADWLDSGQWDGEERVEKVLACLNALNEEYAMTVMKRWLVGAVASLYEPNFSSKLVPVLHGDQCFRKTAFLSRLCNIFANAFLEGAELNPDNKDSVLSCMRAWLTELGELERTNKNSQGSLKAFITKTTDTVRPPYAKRDIKKPRQSHLIATVNGLGFLKDDTGSSRFCVIEMGSPADMDTLNKILGWQYNPSGALRLLEPELLRQFWLEVKHMYQSGYGWNLTDQERAFAAKINDEYQDKGSWYDYILGAYLSTDNDKYFDEWRNAASLVDADPKLQAVNTKVIGKALAQLHKEGFLEVETRRGGAKFYRKRVTSFGAK